VQVREGGEHARQYAGEAVSAGPLPGERYLLDDVRGDDVGEGVVDVTPVDDVVDEAVQKQAHILREGTGLCGHDWSFLWG
jgi:hypothetical protein